MKRNLFVWLTALAVAVVTFLLCFFQPLYTVDKMLADTLYQRPSVSAEATTLPESSRNQIPSLEITTGVPWGDRARSEIKSS